MVKQSKKMGKDEKKQIQLIPRKTLNNFHKVEIKDYKGAHSPTVTDIRRGSKPSQKEAHYDNIIDSENNLVLQSIADLSEIQVNESNFESSFKNDQSGFGSNH